MTQSCFGGPPGRSSDGDNDLAACATLSQVPDGLCNLAQRECSVDNRLDRACLQELAQYLQVILARRCDQRTQPLTHEQREHLCPELAIDASEPLSAPFSSNDHERPLRAESAPQVRQGAVPGDVEDDVVAAAGVRGGLPGVVHYVVGGRRAPH